MSEQNKEDRINAALKKRQGKTCVFRDPIHGLVTVYPWERALIDTEEFQRLRRIHQLSMTYLIYHGAEHTRFGHSIGVMHVAGRVMDHLRHFSPLHNLSDDEFFEKRALVRMAGLLHDLGHGCFSHIGEGKNNIYPNLKDPINDEMVSGHEAYTRCIIKERLAPVIESFWPREKYHMVEDILLILSQSTIDPEYRFFDDIISGQLDCDKMDYLLRDSHYCGVEYGVYDLDKLIHSLEVAQIGDTPSAGSYSYGYPVLAINQSGIQAVEEFVLARYWMFIQVYFHKDRRLFDYYLSSFMKEYLSLEETKTGQYPDDLNHYLELDDSKILCAIKKYAHLRPDTSTEKICYFAKRLFTREHHKVVFNPPYVHFNEKDKEERDAYRRISFVNRHIRDSLNTVEVDAEDLRLYVDLATGSTAKHMFNIKVYNEEQSPDMQSGEKFCQELPAIPVVSKHDNSKFPIQDYSFTLRSISGRQIGILRIYAEDDIAAETQCKCQELYADGFTKHMAKIEETREELRAIKNEEARLKKREDLLNDELNKLENDIS